MQNINDEIIYSPSDITSWVKCQWAYVRKLDSKLDKGNVVPPDNDPMMLYSARNGLRHEAYVLSLLQKKHGVENVCIISDDDLPKEAPRLEKLQMMAARTESALEQRWPVVFQASFFDGKYTGFADFLEWTNIDGSWAYEVLDTKLALSDKDHVYDMQLASYGRHLRRMGVPVHDQARLIHGDLSESVFILSEVESRLDLYLDRHNKIENDRRADSAPIAWLSSEYSMCGKCASCAEQIDLDPGDLLRVAGLGPAKRNLLVSCGIIRIPDLAAVGSTTSIGIPPNTLKKLVSQAQRQWRALQTDNPQIQLENSAAIEALPPRSPGDLYFDFETDPIFYVEGSNRLGIAYLFGFLTESKNKFDTFTSSQDEQFHFLWADDREQEYGHFTTFMTMLLAHLSEFGDAHVYHYSSFELTTLRQLAKQYNSFASELEDLIAQGTFVDLKTTVTTAVSHGLAGYSIKQLEPLYMGKELRTGTKNATSSITRYDDYHRTRNGEELELGETADEIKDDVLQYNRYDCYSMLKLRNWLEDLADSKDTQHE